VAEGSGLDQTGRAECRAEGWTDGLSKTDRERVNMVRCSFVFPDTTYTTKHYSRCQGVSESFFQVAPEMLWPLGLVMTETNHSGSSSPSSPALLPREKGARFKVPLPSGEGFRVRADLYR
jgi:hypothetical protein